MKGIVIYKGKYGATRQYAEWIGEKQSIPITTSDDIQGEQLTQYDFLVLGSAVYFGKLLLSKWLKRNQQFLLGKKLFLFTVSGAPPDKTELLQSYIQDNVPAELRDKLEVYFLPGRLKAKSLSWFHYIMLRLGARLEKDPVTKKGMLTDHDDVQKENILGLQNSIDRFGRVPA